MSDPTTVEQALAGLPTTYRQVDHWVRQGHLNVPAPGTGANRAWSRRELKVLRYMAMLVQAGFRPDHAAPVARAAVDHDTSVVKVTNFVTVAIDLRREENDDAGS